MREPMSVETVGKQLHVVWRERSNATFAVYPAVPVPDNIWKDVYAAVDGAVRLVATVHGVHVPATTVPEAFECPTEEG